jgi:uncharacterized protein (DUF1499 family)
MERMRKVVRGAGGDIKTSTDTYLHAVFTSRVFGFPDDLEVAIIPNEFVQLRSVSRLGSSDFGVNSRRVEDIVRSLTP